MDCQALARRVRRTAAGAVACLLTASAGAVTTTIHDFIVTKNGGAFFLDSFADGLAPPSSPPFADGTPHAYYVAGLYPAGSEAGGSLVLDSRLGASTRTADNQPSLTQRATLLSNADPVNTQRGLKPNHAFTVSSLVDIATASGPGSVAVRLTDRLVNPDGSSSITEFVSVDFVPTAGVVRLRRQDFGAGVVTAISSIPVPIGADQVRLMLSHPVPGVPLVYGSAEFFDGSESMGVFNVPGAAGIFTARGFVRAELAAGETLPIPEPGAYALMLAGVAVVGLRLRAKARAAEGRRLA